MIIIIPTRKSILTKFIKTHCFSINTHHRTGNTNKTHSEQKQKERKHQPHQSMMVVRCEIGMTEALLMRFARPVSTTCSVVFIIEFRFVFACSTWQIGPLRWIRNSLMAVNLFWWFSKGLWEKWRVNFNV